MIYLPEDTIQKNYFSFGSVLYKPSGIDKKCHVCCGSGDFLHSCNPVGMLPPKTPSIVLLKVWNQSLETLLHLTASEKRRL